MKDKCCNYCKHYDPMEGVCLLTKKIVDYLDGYCKKYKEDDFFKDIEQVNMSSKELLNCLIESSSLREDLLNKVGGL